MVTLLFVAAIVVAFLWMRSRRKKVASVPASQSVAVDRWMKQALPGVLASRLEKKGVDRAHLASTLGGDPDGPVVVAIEQAVRVIELEYVRDAHLPDLEVRARVRFEDGTEESVSTRLAYADAPESVRQDFERKATTRAFRKWDFPWLKGL